MVKLHRLNPKSEGRLTGSRTLRKSQFSNINSDDDNSTYFSFTKTRVPLKVVEPLLLERSSPDLP